MHLPNIFEAGAHKFLKSTTSVKLFMLVSSGGECAQWATQGGLLACDEYTVIFSYLLRVLCFIACFSNHCGRNNWIFFHVRNWKGRILQSVQWQEKQKHSLKMETVDRNPEEACCETACAQVKLQPAEHSLVLRSRSFSHIQSLPCTPLLRAVESPRGGRGEGGPVNFGWTHSGNYFLFGPIALSVVLIPTVEGPALPPNPLRPSVCLGFVWCASL